MNSVILFLSQETLLTPEPLERYGLLVRVPFRVAEQPLV